MCKIFPIILIFSFSVLAQDNFTSQNYFKEAVAVKMAEREANEKAADVKAERKPRGCTGICENKWYETQKRNIAAAEAEAAKKTAEAEAAVKKAAEYMGVQYLEAEMEIENIIADEIDKKSNENKYEDFTDMQRVAASFLNFIPSLGICAINYDIKATLAISAFSGLGSLVIMDDIIGAAIQWGFVNGGLLYGALNMAYNDDCPGFSCLGVAMLSSILIGTGIYWGASRPRFYHKPKPNNTAHQNDGFSVAILPDKQNNFKTYLLYNKAF